MKYIILFLVLFQFTLQAPFGWVQCDDGKTICFEGFKCCKMKVGYNCCRENQRCSADGKKCLNYNPLLTRFEETPAVSGRNSNSDVMTAIHNFLRAIQFQTRFPETVECVHKHAPLVSFISMWIKKLMKVKSIEEIFPLITDFVDKIYPKIKEAIADCKGIPKEFKENFERIKGIVSQPGYINKLLENAKKNSIQIMIKVVAIGTAFQQKKYPEVGTYLGDVFMLIFKF